ncbi:hypothetical protein GCM10027286_36330 [Virgibacillus ainsalahensis]
METHTTIELPLGKVCLLEYGSFLRAAKIYRFIVEWVTSEYDLPSQLVISLD